MTQPSKGWYTDPTSEYMYRYWNGTQWTNQVSSSGTTLNDPNTMDPSAASTPPAPGSEAASPPQGDVAPTVQVTQKSGGFGTVIAAIVAIVAVVVLIVVLVNLSGDDSPTSDTEVPATAPVTTVAP
ncbi:MAG: DUF2510 domain-containing protein [Actinobacteria bacterium]|nr:DUF2510 domain-containing protein [Actinomycetota bacterium]